MSNPYKARYINAILEASISVLETLLKEKMPRESLLVKNRLMPSHDISIKINILGDVKGIIIYSLTKDCATNIVKILMPGMDNILNEHYSDVLGEIGNMISGSATSLISKEVKDINITPPEVILDTLSGNKISEEQKTLVITFQSNFGAFEVNICFN